MKAAFYTLGCKVNQYETQLMSQQLESMGFTLVDRKQDPDVFIINSCTVTAESDRKTRQSLHRFRRLYPGAVLVLTGCMPQAFPNDALELHDADIVLGNANRSELGRAVEKYLHTGQRAVKVMPHEKDFSKGSLHSFADRTRAFVKIEDGCNRFCSYCIIPTARGRVRSKPPAGIREEVTALAAAGFREVVLVGINLSAYGKDLDLNLCDALDAASSVQAIERVRLGSMEPDQITGEMIDRFRANRKLCPHFHLSLQSGCDATLRRMNRHYDRAAYRDICNRLRSTFNIPSITTDIMVGFPGETESEFIDTLAFAEEMTFAKAHVFAYSRRPGTAAAEYPDQIPSAVKTERSHRMIDLTNRTRNMFLQRMAGSVQTVLFETGSDGVYTGYTPNYTPVQVKSNVNLTGKILPVSLVSTDGNVCFGQVAKNI